MVGVGVLDVEGMVDDPDAGAEIDRGVGDVCPLGEAAVDRLLSEHSTASASRTGASTAVTASVSAFARTASVVAVLRSRTASTGI
jgi:hypothetical protein